MAISRAAASDKASQAPKLPVATGHSMAAVVDRVLVLGLNGAALFRAAAVTGLAAVPEVFPAGGQVADLERA